MNDKLFDAILELKEKEALTLVREKVRSGEDPIAIMELCRKALTSVGDRYAKKEYFLSEMIVAAEIFREIMEILESHIPARTGTAKAIGKIVIGTVKGDIHDIGKNIAVSMLKINGFDVFDLGVDVPPESFVAEIRKVDPEIVGMSGLITVSWDSMKETVKAIEDAGLRDEVKIIIGGGAANEEAARYVGADACAAEVMKGIDVCKRWMESMKRER